MKIDIYQSALHGDKYLSVPAGTNVKNITLPIGTDEDLLTLSPFRSFLELDPNNPRIGLDYNDVAEKIKRDGFAIHGATISINLNKNR